MVAGMLIRDGRVRRAYLGIGGAATAIGRQLANELGITNTSGIRVLEVVAGGPAQRAGLTVRDLIVSLDGSAVATLSDLQRSLGADRIGRSIEVGYVRFGELHRTTVTPVEAR